MSAHQLRILASVTATAASASYNTNGEQDPTALFDQMAELFQLTPQPRRRTNVMSPSVVAVDALLNDIGDPQRLLSEMVAAATASSDGPSCHEPATILMQTKKGRKAAVAAKDKAAGGTNAIKKTKRATAAAAAAAAAAARTPATKKAKTSPSTPSAAVKTESASSPSNKTAGCQHSLDDHTEAAEDARDVIVNVSRARQKEEMAHLRVKVRELERELRKLGNKSPPTLSSSTTNTISSTYNSSSSPVDKQTQPSSGWSAPRKPIWERLANGAKDRKHHAEVENLRLRETVATQKKLSRSLEKILMKRSNLSVRTNLSLPELTCHDVSLTTLCVSTVYRS